MPKVNILPKEIREHLQISAFAAYVCLVWGILLLLGDAGNFSYYRVLVLGSGLLLCGGLWLGRQRGRDGLNSVCLLFAVYAGILFLQRKALREQFDSFLLCLMQMEDGAGDFTLLFLSFSLVLSLFCLFLVFVLKKGWMFYGLTLTLLFLGPMFGYPPSWPILGLLAVFHIGNSLYFAVYQTWSDEAKEGSTRAIVLQQSFIAGLAVVLAAFFLAHLVPAGNRKDWMKHSIQFIWNWTSETRHQMGFGGDGMAKGPSGKINRGNYFPSGAVQIEVTLSKQPEESIYLKSFTGRDYLGDGWEETDETDFYVQFNEHQEDYSRYFAQRQFQLIQYGKRSDWNWEEEQSNTIPWVSEEYKAWSGVWQMRIRPFNRLLPAFYQPYLVLYTDHDSDGGDSFSCFSWKEYERYNKQRKEEGLTWPDLFEHLEELYRDYVQKNYLDVPEERLSRLLALCREHPLTEPEEITAFIRRMLTEHASYSRTPGFMPYGTDIAEYFLFDGQEGYCQHFATAAVLMYRMYNIPARYAAGYRAEPGDFSQGKDGQYAAQLTEEKAHAWVEIYLGGPGWIPVEVTPPAEVQGSGKAEEDSKGGQDRFNPGRWFEQEETSLEETSGETGNKTRDNDLLSGETSGDWEDGLDLQEWDVWEDETAKDERNGSEQDNGRSELLNQDSSEPDVQQEYPLYRKLAIIVAGLFLFLGGSGWLLRKYRGKKLEQMGADEVYKEMVDLLHLGGYLENYDGTEADFPEVLMQQRTLNLNQMLSLEEIKMVKDNAFQSAYGPDVSSAKERKQAVNVYRQVYHLVIKNAKGLKKLKAAVRGMG